jgi:signal transduction histidine kinase
VIRQLTGCSGAWTKRSNRERALTADVAHELRTPVAEIRAIAEIALTRERDAGEYREALDETKDSITTLQGLIERLLVLARLEAGQARAEVEAVALHPFVCKHWTQIQCRRRIAASRSRTSVLLRRWSAPILVSWKSF